MFESMRVKLGDKKTYYSFARIVIKLPERNKQTKKK